MAEEAGCLDFHRSLINRAIVGGCRPLLLGSVAIYGLASLLTAFVGSLPMLSVVRFFTGLGIGGAFPGAATLTGDYAPQRRHATMIMASFTGVPFGGFLCGQAAGLLGLFWMCRG